MIFNLTVYVLPKVTFQYNSSLCLDCYLNAQCLLAAFCPNEGFQDLANEAYIRLNSYTSNINFSDAKPHLHAGELHLLRVVVPLPHDGHQQSRLAMPVKQLPQSTQDNPGSFGTWLGKYFGKFQLNAPNLQFLVLLEESNVCIGTGTWPNNSV